MHIVTNWIGGQPEQPAGNSLDLVDPATGQTYGSAPDSAREPIGRAVDAARAAFTDWAATTPGHRAGLLLRFADALVSHADDLADIEVAATGKPFPAAYSEIDASADVLRFYAGACRTVTSPAAASYSPNTSSWVRRDPVGVVVAITPWNYPLMMAAWKLAPALAAGNTVVIKPAPGTPRSTRLAAEIASQVGFPPGVLNVVCGGAATGRMLVAEPGPDMVAFTGSVATGRDIMRRAGLKRVHLELGGNAPVVVFEDADLDAVVADVVAAGFGNAGQSCTAACRVLVHEAVADEFTKRLVAAVPETADGPLHSQAHRARVHEFVAGLGGHARVLVGGEPEDKPGWWYRPTVVADVLPGDRIVRDEVFGPVVTVQRFASYTAAVTLASSVSQRLAASVYTADHRRALAMAAELPFGWVGINACHRPVAELPHSGFGESGRGTDLSIFGLDAYTQAKTITSVM